MIGPTVYNQSEIPRSEVEIIAFERIMLWRSRESVCSSRRCFVFSGRSPTYSLSPPFERENAAQPCAESTVSKPLLYASCAATNAGCGVAILVRADWPSNLIPSEFSRVLEMRG